MNIRSLTVGAALPADEASRAELVFRLGSFSQMGKAALQAAGFAVQTTRLSTQPLEQWLPAGDNALQAMAELGRLCTEAGLDYCSLGTVQAATPQGAPVLLLDALPYLLMQADNLFGSIQVGARTNGRGGINMAAVGAAARTIHKLAEATPEGFGNLRFAAAANCPPHVPFFPASYYEADSKNGGRPEFGLALEAADLAFRAFAGAATLDEARSNLLGLLEEEAGKAAQVCVALSVEHGYSFTGLDISPAPHPDPDKSIAGALETVIGGPLGSPGSLAAAAFFTGVLRQAATQLPTVGYSGLMLPALEDSILAARTAEGLVTLDTLLLLSAVCGLGLDTVPLPGDVTERQLERIILDMAALAVKLDKPLTARLLPVPGKQAGDPAEWPAFPYFARGRVMAVAGQAEPPAPASGLMNNGYVNLL